MSGPVEVRALDGFDDPSFSARDWERLLQQGGSRWAFTTPQWQRAWWDTLGRGRLSLLLAERDGQPVALAPMLAFDGVAYFVGSTDDSDYLDFVGRVDGDGVLDALLTALFDREPGLAGVRLFHVPAASPTTAALHAAAARLGLSCRQEDADVSPVLELAAETGAGDGAGGGEAEPPQAGKKSLVRHERAMRREGALEFHHLHDGASIAPHLEEFFQQHVTRWAAVDQPYPSLLGTPSYQRFYYRLMETAGATGWLRFSRLDWNGRPAAFHFGWCYDGRYLWYKPSFDIALAHRSPGEVLLRQVLLAAAADGARLFDFGLGDEAYKLRFATRMDHVRSWGLYPGSAPGPPRA